MVGNLYRDVMHWVVTLNMRDWFWVLLPAGYVPPSTVPKGAST